MRKSLELIGSAVCGIALSLSLIGCATSAGAPASSREADPIAEETEESNKKKDSKQEESKEKPAREADAIGGNDKEKSPHDEDSQKENESEKASSSEKATTLSVGETKATEDYELTILSAEWADEVYPDTSQTSGSYMYFADEEGKSYYVVKLSFHNLMSGFYAFEDHPQTTEQQFTFNDKYQFAAAVYDPEVTGLFTSGICYGVEPLDTRTYYIVASVSDDIRNDMTSGQLSFKLRQITVTDAEHFNLEDGYIGNYLIDLG